MAEDRLGALLANVELFAALDPRSRRALEATMRRVAVADGQVLCHEGEVGDRMYVVGSGELRVLKRGSTGAPIEITRLRAGEVAGMMSLFENEPRSATLQAAGPVEVWEMDKAAFARLLDTEPSLGRGLVTVLSRYLRHSTRTVAELRSRDADARLKVAVFDSKPYTEQSFTLHNRDRYALKFYESRLGTDTTSMADGFRVVCPFVNDSLDAGVVEKLGSLGVELVALRCAGYNNVDLEACERAGISVCRVPAYSPYAVAEHAVALMMALNRHIHRAHNRVREGNFSLNGLVGFDMHDKTVGVVGTGKIGRCVISILLGFGCRVLASDRSRDAAAEALGVRYVGLEELLRSSDIITLHAPLTPETHHMIGERTVGLLKPGVMLINTSRGGLVDTQCLIKGLLSGRIGSAGLDVYEEESGYFYEDRSGSVITDETLARLMTLSNVMITSHMAFLTREALANIAETTFANIAEYEAGRRGAVLTNGVAARPGTEAR
jgi:D-lactate dehydrogenase